MEALLAVLSWTIMMTNCLFSPVTPTTQGYYTPWSYEVTYCTGRWGDFDRVIVHELAHLFWFEYLGRDYSNPEKAEAFAYWFERIYIGKNVEPLLKVINKIVLASKE